MIKAGTFNTCTSLTARGPDSLGSFFTKNGQRGLRTTRRSGFMMTLGATKPPSEPRKYVALRRSDDLGAEKRPTLKSTAE
jgi:hypothetical protein